MGMPEPDEPIKTSLSEAAEKYGASPEEDSDNSPVSKEKIGRNDMCPCGSGLKYKKCCGKQQSENFMSVDIADLKRQSKELEKRLLQAKECL